MQVRREEDPSNHTVWTWHALLTITVFSVAHSGRYNFMKTRDRHQMITPTEITVALVAMKLKSITTRVVCCRCARLICRRAIPRYTWPASQDRGLCISPHYRAPFITRLSHDQDKFEGNFDSPQRNPSDHAVKNVWPCPWNMSKLK